MDIKLACLNLAKDFSWRVFNLGIFPNHLEKRENKYPKGKCLWRCPEMPEKRKLACTHAQLGLSSVTDLHLHIWCSHAHTFHLKAKAENSCSLDLSMKCDYRQN